MCKRSRNFPKQLSVKKKIIIVVLAGVALLLFVLALSVKDALWFHSMMVDKILAEVYPDNKASVAERLRRYGHLFNAGEQAAKQLEWANTVWDDPDSTPEDYQKAAMAIVTDLGINKKQWLSLGNIVKHFGVPGNVEGLFPITDDDGNLLVVPIDFNVYYEDRNIRFNFALSGLLESVMLVTHNGAKETGTSKLYWPHDYTYAKRFPICAGFEYDKKTIKFILNRTRERVLEAIEKGAFFGNIERLTPQEKDLIDINNMRIYMVDGINRQLAIAYLEFSTKDMTVCYSRWFYKSDGQWYDDSIRNIAEIVKDKFKEEG